MIKIGILGAEWRRISLDYIDIFKKQSNKRQEKND